MKNLKKNIYTQAHVAVRHDAPLWVRALSNEQFYLRVQKRLRDGVLMIIRAQVVLNEQS